MTKKKKELQYHIRCTSFLEKRVFVYGLNKYRRVRNICRLSWLWSGAGHARATSASPGRPAPSVSVAVAVAVPFMLLIFRSFDVSF